MANKNMKKRAGIAVAAGVVVAGALGASAASLGVLNASNLGSASTTVAACQQAGVPINVDWKNATPAKGEAYKATTTDVIVSDLSDTCKGGEYQLVVTDKADIPLQTFTGTVKDSSFKDELTNVPTDSIYGVTLTITGGTAA